MVWEVDVAGDTPALSAVLAPVGPWSIAMADDEKITWTTSQATAGSFLTITNPVDPIAAQVYLVDLTYSVDDGQALADYIIARDAGGTVFTLQENGNITRCSRIGSFTDCNRSRFVRGRQVRTGPGAPTNDLGVDGSCQGLGAGGGTWRKSPTGGTPGRPGGRGFH